MHRVASIVVVLLACFALGLGGGCTTDEPGSPSSGGSGGAGGADASAAWSNNACHGCFATRCTAEVTSCRQDPTCAVHLECVDACPADASGGPTESCVQACPGADGAAALTACLASAEAGCVECGGSALDAGSDAPVCTTPLLCQECADSAETNPCWKCQDERCCESDQTCRDDPGCLSYFMCMQTCLATGDTAGCVEQCDASVGPEHYVGYTTKISCILVHCLEPTACGDGPVEACLACTNAQCANERVSCDMDADCARLSLCIQDCASDACYDACYAAHPGGLDKLNTFGECALAKCEDPCST